MDNEASLQSLVNAALMKSNCRSFHPRHVVVARPQAKKLERFVGICREGVFANWLQTVEGVGSTTIESSTERTLSMRQSVHERITDK